MADATLSAASPLMGAPVAGQGKQGDPVLTLEVCMTKLDAEAAGRFFFGEAESKRVDAKAVTTESGIQELLPLSSIDDFCFTPCGYSMNGIEEGKHSTIHITPEDGFSYASFEARGYAHDTTDLKELLANVLSIFKPGCVSVALHADGQVPAQLLGGRGTRGGVHWAFLRATGAAAPRSSSCWEAALLSSTPSRQRART